MAKDVTRLGKNPILMILAILIAAQASYTAPVDLEKLAAIDDELNFWGVPQSKFAGN